MNNIKVFKNYEEFQKRKDKDINGVSEDFALYNYGYISENITNSGCWNCATCVDCRYCRNCFGCKGCILGVWLIDCIKSENCTECADLVNCDSLRECNSYVNKGKSSTFSKYGKVVLILTILALTGSLIVEIIKDILI